MRINTLSEPQLKIIKLTAEGFASCEIASKLSVGTKYVMNTKYQICKKFKTHSMYKVISECFRNQIID